MSTDLEARVKALEDLIQNLGRCLIAPPTPTKDAPAILSKFPNEQADRLDAEKNGATWKVTPNHFLPTQQWQEINKTVQTLNGKYVAATNGEPGHWTIPA